MSERCSESWSFPPFLSKRKIDVKICLGSEEPDTVICLVLGCPMTSLPDSPMQECFAEAFEMTFHLCFHDSQLVFRI